MANLTTTAAKENEELLNQIRNLGDFESSAKSILHAKHQIADWVFLESGSTQEETIRLNKIAFQNLRIRPRYLLRDVTNRNLATSVLGMKISFPIGVSPSAIQKTWNEEGELATAKAVEELGSFMILSSSSSFTIEEVAAAAPNAIKWFQISLLNTENFNYDKDLIRRAESAGFKAIVFTVDSQVYHTRYAASEFNFRIHEKRLGNFEKYPNYVHLHKADVKFSELGKLTKLPIVFKGILTAEDARAAVGFGASAIIVSNHGGRQLDGIPSTIEALPEIVKEVKGEVEIYLDSGIRSGKDVFKALALGATSVLIGRAVPWGLTVAGQAGVTKVLNILSKELDAIMGGTGCTAVADIQANHVAHKMEYAVNTLRSTSYINGKTIEKILR